MKKQLSYIDSVHRDGRIWNLSMVVILLLFPVFVGILFHAKIDWRGFALGMLSTAPMYWAVGVIETFTYVPMLGAGGSYLAFVTGVVLITPLTPLLNSPVLAPAFDQILPALFGGLGVVYIARNWKIAVAPVLLMLILFISIPGLGSYVGILVPVGVLVALGVSRILYKKGLL